VLKSEHFSKLYFKEMHLNEFKFVTWWIITIKNKKFYTNAIYNFIVKLFRYSEGDLDVCCRTLDDSVCVCVRCQGQIWPLRWILHNNMVQLTTFLLLHFIVLRWWVVCCSVIFVLNQLLSFVVRFSWERERKREGKTV